MVQVVDLPQPDSPAMPRISSSAIATQPLLCILPGVDE
jgi:hypothetical protein